MFDIAAVMFDIVVLMFDIDLCNSLIVVLMFDIAAVMFDIVVLMFDIDHSFDLHHCSLQLCLEHWTDL